jgi:outer membrane protein
MPTQRLRFTDLRAHAKALALVFAVSAAFVGTANAQSLRELYELARGFDASYLAARSLAESAVYRAAQSDALRLPNVGASAGITRSEIGTPISSQLNSNNAQAQIKGTQPLFNRTNAALVSQSDKALDASKADFEIAEQDLIVRVAQAYFDVLAAQDALETTRAGKAAITEQLASAKRNFEVGTATITDTREAQARFDLAVAQEIAAENDLRTKRIALDQLVGRNAVAPKPLAPAVTLPPVTPGNVETWVSDAYGRHPSIRKAQLNEDIAKLETSKARAGHLPTVDLVGSFTDSHSTGSYVRLTSSEGTTRTTSLGVQLNLPLFAGFSVQNRIKETLSLEEKAHNDLEAARRAVALGTRQVFFGVQSGQAQVKALEAAESSSKLALEATQLGYRVGVRVNLDVLNAQTQLYTTQRDLAKARYDVIVNSLRLRQAAGLLKPEDLQAANALLAQ